MPAAANASRSARARVRAELAQEIRAAARTHLGVEGAAGLSLRAVARDLGMVPSALYRYYPSRDALLTALIVDAYRDLGEAARAADAAVDIGDHAERWLTTTRRIRRWGLDHPQEWALIYGSPVPGYRAPPETVDPAVVVTTVLGGILGDAYRAGSLRPVELSVPTDLSSDLAHVAQVIGALPASTTVAAMVAWACVLGSVSLELFGHYDNTIDARASLWDAAMVVVARGAGLDIISTTSPGS